MVNRHLNYEFAVLDQSSASMDFRRSNTSNGIAIKRSRQFEGSSHGSSEKMYDWATWRMYHRITSARKARTIVPVETSFADKVDDASDVMKMDLERRATPNLSDETESITTLTDPMEGEVFELDF